MRTNKRKQLERVRKIGDGEIIETSGDSDDRSSGSSLLSEESVIHNMPNEQGEHNNEEVESEETEGDAIINTDDKEKSSYTHKHQPGIACLYTHADSLLGKRDLLKHRIN